MTDEKAPHIAFKGPSGWWAYNDDYREGSIGPYESFRELAEYLATCDAYIVDIDDNPNGVEPPRTEDTP